ncbi:hypothetical protein [Bradyrhizobium sp. HKCCYLR20261]|uniref:hypothetical protein n=1 Tax=Bradyrhizobium sp. HKCCYLR20261 TaxID=3420760 RepID=UPI003EBFD807
MKTVELGVHEFQSVAGGLVHAAVDAGESIAESAEDAFNTVTHGAGQLAAEALHGADEVIGAIGEGAGALGHGVVDAATDAGRAAGNIAGDLLDTGGKLGGDLANGLSHLAEGDIGGALEDAKDFGRDLAAGAGDVAGHAAQGAADIGQDLGHAAAGIAHAVVDGASGLGSAALDMAGTAAGIAGELAQDYEHAMGALAKGAVEAVVAIAAGETDLVAGAVQIGAEAVGGPVGDFYGDLAHGYGEAAKDTLHHVGGAIEDGVGKLTDAGGELSHAVGSGADQLSHDAGRVADDLGRGDIDAALHDVGRLGSDAADAATEVLEAQKHGAEALADASADVATVLHGLDEAVERAGSAFVDTVGRQIGGDVGAAISDVGHAMLDGTDVMDDLAKGDLAGAASSAADGLGKAAGNWLEHQLDDIGSSIADRAGNALSDLLGAGGKAGDAASPVQPGETGGHGAGGFWETAAAGLDLPAPSLTPEPHDSAILLPEESSVASWDPPDLVADDGIVPSGGAHHDEAPVFDLTHVLATQTSDAHLVGLHG